MKRSSSMSCLFTWAVISAIPSLAAATDAPTAVPLQEVAEGVSQRRVEFEQTARQSSDLRLRILFSQRMAPGPSDQYIQDVTPLGALVDSARGSTDPLVLELLLGRCRSQSKADASICDPVDIARRWAAVDAQNAVPWIELASVLAKAGDEKAADEAWTKAARAATLRDSYYPIVRLLLSSFPADADPRVRYLDLTYAIGWAAAVPDMWMWDVKTGCKSDARRAACSSIADMAFRDGDAIHAVQAGRLLTTQTKQEQWLRASRQQTEEALQWALSRLDVDTGYGTLDATDLQAVVKLNRMIEDRVAHGDVTAARNELHSLHVSEAEGAKRYKVYMAELMDRLHSN
jgi:hypothetical protein